MFTTNIGGAHQDYWRNARGRFSASLTQEIVTNGSEFRDVTKIVFQLSVAPETETLFMFVERVCVHEFLKKALICIGRYDEEFGGQRIQLE